MKLLVVSHTPHYISEGKPYGWGPTIREMDHLGELFAEIVHLAPLHAGAPPNSARTYHSRNVRVRFVPPAGGSGIRDKIKILSAIPAYVYAIWDELRSANVVHVRCPANISLIALVVLAMSRRPCVRWVKYAGNWQPGATESRSYTFQRWYLNKRLHRGVVTVNGEWPGQPQHVHTFYNPCLSPEELRDGREASGEKYMTSPMRLLFVGSLESTKGVGKTLHILARLREHGVPARLDLAGDGPGRMEFENLAGELHIEQAVNFHGPLTRQQLSDLYAQAHIIILPTDSEGWPKVISEAMAYGVVPVSSNVSCIPQYLRRFATGKTFLPNDIEAFTEAIRWYYSNPVKWKEESNNSVKAAKCFSYPRYLEAVRGLLHMGLIAESSENHACGA